MTDSVELRFYAGLYADLFAGRRDAHSPWIGTQWVASREPLTPDVVLGAFTTRRPVGAYILGPDSQTHIAALDVDLDDGLLIADRVASAIWKAGGRAYVETSRRGAHMWCLLEEKRPAILVRRALRAFLARAGVAPDPKIELRPGQDRLGGPEGLGNALRMPLMPHPLTGKRPPGLMAPRGRIVARTLAELCDERLVEYTPAALFEEVAAEHVEAVDPTSIPARFRKPRKRADDADDTVDEVLAELGLPIRPGHAVKCPFHDDRHPSLSIADDRRRVFCKSPECEAYAGGRGLGANQLRELAAAHGRVAA
jgi:hypothetical protein